MQLVLNCQDADPYIQNPNAQSLMPIASTSPDEAHQDPRGLGAESNYATCTQYIGEVESMLTKLCAPSSLRVFVAIRLHVLPQRPKTRRITKKGKETMQLVLNY